MRKWPPTAHRSRRPRAAALSWRCRANCQSKASRRMFTKRFNPHAALAASIYPKLLFVAEPGALVSPAFAEKFVGTLQHCAVVGLGAGKHYLQEDHPEAIGRSVAGWIAGIEAVTSGRVEAA